MYHEEHEDSRRKENFNIFLAKKCNSNYGKYDRIKFIVKISAFKKLAAAKLKINIFFIK